MNCVDINFFVGKVSVHTGTLITGKSRVDKCRMMMISNHSPCLCTSVLSVANSTYIQYNGGNFFLATVDKCSNVHFPHKLDLKRQFWQTALVGNGKI